MNEAICRDLSKLLRKHKLTAASDMIDVGLSYPGARKARQRMLSCCLALALTELE